jgi:ParB family chromosome partitioning protein
MVFETESCLRTALEKAYHEHSKLKSIAISEINTEDKTFRITTSAEVNDLAASIQQLGLLRFPVLRQNGSDFTVISGFRRIAACRQNGSPQMRARVVNSDTDKQTCMLLAIADNSLQRPLNLLEISRSLNLLSGFLEDPNLLSQYAFALGLPHHLDYINKVMKICRLPVSIQDAVATGAIALAVALDLFKLEPDIGVDLVELFNRLKIGTNKQRELLTLLVEISIREKTTMKNLLNNKDLKKIMVSDEPDHVQRRRHLKEFLMRRRFPTIFDTQTRFKHITKTLKLGDTVKLIPPKDFEGSTYKLTAQFRTHAELSDLRTKLDAIIQNPKLKAFLAG